MTELLLLSNSTSPGRGFLEHALDAIAELVPARGQLLFVPFAASDRDHEGYTELMAAALAPLSVRVVGAHQVGNPAEAVTVADAVFVGGGNSFRLLKALQDSGLGAAIAAAVRAGLPYLGSSAGTNVACPTLRTTNDMPIVQPASFQALGLIPVQINPHYLDRDPASTHQGETRQQRIEQFLECNDVPVLGLREGAWLRVHGNAAASATAARATAVTGGTTWSRLFERRTEPRELPPGSDVSSLLAVTPRFDTE
jgi:dipeptidase E